jgi:predicted acyltransferase
MPFDPEGLLSTLPATATVLLGFMAGGLISANGSSWKTPGWLALTGTLLIGAGLLWGQYFPINKPIWTSSYVIYAGGIGMVILALLFIIIDIWNLKGWTGFFNTFGTNPLFTYVLAGMLTKTMLAVK